MTQTLTTEQLRALRDALKSWQDGYDPTDDKEQYEMFVTAETAVGELLTNREAQPVMWAHERKLSTDVAITKDAAVAAAWESEGLSVKPLYTAPPAPTVPDEIDSFADQVIGTKDKIIHLPAPMPVPLEGIRVYLNADAVISFLEKQGYIVEVSRE